MTQSDWTHEPVLYREICQLLVTDRDGIYLDATLGLGGHAGKILDLLSPEGRLIGMDLDAKSSELAARNLQRHAGRFKIIRGNFSDAAKLLRENAEGPVSGALFDLGLNSYQLDDPQRGFGFKNCGPLDMRFDPDAALTAREIVNTWPPEQLERILRDYGEERFASRISASIIRARPIETTSQLRIAIEKISPRKGSKINPATRTFQALRIAVNSELENVNKALSSLEEIIKPGGRAAVITFHSLEDRIVKHAFRRLAQQGNWKLTSKKPIPPSREETATNPRARSAKLRVIEHCL